MCLNWYTAGYQVMLIRTRAQNPVRIPFDVKDMVSTWSDSFNCIFYVRKIITMIRTLVSVYVARMWHDEGKLNLPNSAKLTTMRLLFLQRFAFAALMPLPDVAVPHVVLSLNFTGCSLSSHSRQVSACRHLPGGALHAHTA